MKIVAFAGSNSSQSINKKLVKHVLSYFKNAEINLLDLNNYEMPIYSADREKNDGYPKLAHDFLEQLKNSDAIILSLAEHNNSYSTAFKNIFDWCSRIDKTLFQNKPMLLMSTSPGGFGGGNVMNAAKAFFPKCGANIIDTFSLPSFPKNFTETEGILDPILKAELETKITHFKSLI